MKCTWEVSGNNFEDFKDLYEYVRDNYKIDEDSDIIHSRELTQSEALDKLRKIKTLSRVKKSSYSRNQDEIFDIPDNDNYIELHKFIQEGKKIDGITSFTTPYDPVSLAEKLKTEKKYTDEEITKLFDLFERTEERAYYVKILINTYFNNTNSRTLEGMKRTISTHFPYKIAQEWLKSDAVISKFITQLQKIRNHILNTTGLSTDNILSNVSITADLNGTDKKLYANIDIVAIDKLGVPHVFLFKSSAKHELEQPDVKILKRDYYLGTIRQMLAQNGFNTKFTKLHIIPIQFFEENEELTGIEFGDIVDRTAVLRRDRSSRLDPYTGEVWRDLNNLIPTTIDTTIFSGSIKNKIKTNLSKFFPTHNIKQDPRSKRVSNFIKNRVIKSSKPGISYEFEDKTGKKYYISDPSPIEVNQELREKVAKVIDLEKDIKTNKLSTFLNSISKVINYGAPITSIISSVESSGRLNLALNRYMNGDWEYKSLPKLEELGIAAFQNKSTGQIDFVMLTWEDNLNDKINLGFGDTILGAYKKNHQISGKVKLSATRGNIKFIELMTALDECYAELKDEKIGELRVLNIYSGATLNIQNSMLIDDYKQLCKEANVETHINELEKSFISDIENLKNHIITTLGNVSITDQSLLRTIQERIEKLEVYNRVAIIEECQKIMKLITDSKEGEFLKKGFKDASMAIQNNKKAFELLNLYLIVLQTYMYTKGDWYSVEAMETIGRSSKNTLLSGSMTVTADTIPYKNEANLTGAALQIFQKIRRTFVKFKDDYFENYVKKLWADKGYGQTQNMVVGNQLHIYRNLFAEKDGKLDPNLVFKDPDTDQTLSEQEKRFLKRTLWLINRRRYGLEAYSENSEQVKKKKKEAGEKWFWVPLQEASGGSKLARDYIENNIKQELKEIVSFGEASRQAFKRKEANVYTESEFKEYTTSKDQNKIFIRYTVTDTDQFERTKLLQSKPQGFFEMNVENIMLQYEHTYIRRDELDKFLPHVQVVKFLTEAWGQQAGIDTRVNINYLDDFVKQAIHNVSLLSEQEQENTHLVRKAKMAASYAMIVGNVFAPVRDVLDGLWKGIGIFVGNTWGKEKGFTKQDYVQAYGYVMKDCAESVAGVTVLETLNARYGMSDMDIAQLHRKIKSGKVGLFNFKDKLFWTTTAGDYLNRMVILVAKMIHDGCFEACSYENGFKYDMKKDKRFSTWNGKKCTDPEQNGLYLSMLRDFNNSGYDLKEGDELPDPYTPREMVALKSFADRLYGYYDHELRIQAEKHALGSLFLQFSTYLTGNKTQWFLSPREYDTNVRRQAINADGKLLWWKRVTDVNGEENLIQVTEEELDKNDPREPVMEVAKSYMEGIFYTLRDFCSDVKNLGIVNAWGNIMDCNAKRENIRLLGYKLLMWMIIGAAIKTLLSQWKEHRKKDKSPYTISRAIDDEGFNIFYKAVNGSLDNFNLLKAFGGDVIESEPPVFATAANFVRSTWKAGSNIATGEGVRKSLDSWIYTNSAAYRSLSGLLRGLQKTYEATNNSL